MTLVEGVPAAGVSAARPETVPESGDRLLFGRLCRDGDRFAVTIPSPPASTRHDEQRV